LATPSFGSPQLAAGRVNQLENVKDVVDDPLMKNYYKLTDASKGIALSEYVAIAYLMHH